MSTTLPTDVAPAPAGGATPRRTFLGGNPLVRYIIVRFLLIIPTIFILVSMVFIVMRVAGDPITAALGGRLSPEQLAGGPLDSRSDFYSVGVVLHELLSGKLPYTSSDPNIIRREIASGATINLPNTPRTVKRVCAKALQPNVLRQFAAARPAMVPAPELTVCKCIWHAGRRLRLWKLLCMGNSWGRSLAPCITQCS